MEGNTHVPLASFIRALRRELVEAVKEGNEQEVRFALGPIELELQVEVSSTGGGEAGVKFWLIALGGKAERMSGRTQTLRLTMTPVVGSNVPGDKPLLVGSEQIRRPE
jgi:hypothetical protein